MINPIKKLTFLNRERAQTMVEFALVFPLVLMITYGLIEFGRMIFIYSAVTSSAREGARYGVAAGLVDTNGDGIKDKPQYAYCLGIREAAKRTAFLVTLTSIDIQYDHGTIIPSSPPPGPLPCPPSANSIKLGDRIIVTVTARYEPVIGRFLGISGVDIIRKNYRSILLGIVQ